LVDAEQETAEWRPSRRPSNVIRQHAGTIQSPVGPVSRAVATVAREVDDVESPSGSLCSSVVAAE
jgi:hypothetical protein